MIKKFLISISLAFSFFLMFLFGFDKINILAYTNVENTLGTYPIQLDIDNYNRENLFYTNNNFNYHSFDYNYYYNNGELNISFSGDKTAEITTFISKNMGSNGLYIGSFVLSESNSIYLEPGTYNFSFNYSETFSTPYFIVGDLGEVYNSADFKGVAFGDTIFTISTPKYFCFAIYSYQRQGYFDNVDTFSNIMLVKSDKKPNNYSSFFKFGYEAGYSMSLNNPSSSSFTTSISIKSNDNTLYTGNCTLAANTSTLCNSGKVVYIPFNIDNNGYISLNTNIQVVVNDIGPTINYTDSGLYFETVFNAYYKGLPTTKLYFKNSYVMNNLYLSGFNVGINKDINSNVTFYTNNYDNSYSITTNQNVNVATNKIIATSVRSNIDYTDFFVDNIYNFVINTGVPNVNISNNRIYQINISNLVARVIGSSNTDIPNSSNPDIVDKFNNCSAWYDIPCQLGNGLTYVIYEAPIISPVLTFIVSFITMFSSLVSFVDLFKSFGILFGCFIIYMFIELLHKYSK